MKRIAAAIQHDNLVYDENPESRYMSLFLSHGSPDLDKRRQSFLDSLRAADRRRALTTLRDLEATLQPESGWALLLRESRESWVAACDHTIGAPKDFAA